MADEKHGFLVPCFSQWPLRPPIDSGESLGCFQMHSQPAFLPDFWQIIARLSRCSLLYRPNYRNAAGARHS